MERNNELSFSVRNSGDVASVQPASLRDGGNTPGYVGDLQLLAGEELDSRLQIFERIGGGSSARVYRGILDGSTPVAVKVLHPHAAQRDSTLQEFLREAQVLARLHHKHIIKLYALAHLPPNFGGLPTRRYTWGIVTEYMEAGTLTRLVQDASRALKLQHKARQAMAAAAANNNPPPERSGSLRAMKQSLSFLRRTMTPDAPPSPRTRGGGGAGGSSGVPGTPGAASRIPSTTAGGGGPGSIGPPDHIHVPPLPYSDREALLWCMEVALALQFLHAQNPPVVHRDVKTDNVLMAIAPLGPAPNASPGPRLFGLESGFTSPGAAAAAAAALSGGIGDRAGGVGASHGGLARRVLSLQAAAAALGSESRGASLTITGRPGGGRPLTAKVADFGIHVVLDISRPVAGTRRRSFEEPPPGTIGVYSNTSLTRMSNRPSYTGGPGSGPMAGGGPSGYGGVMGGGGGSLYGSGYGMAGGSGYGAYGHGSSTMHPMQHPSPAAGGRLDTRSRRSSTMSRANEEPMPLRRGISREGDSFTRITGGAGGGLPVVRKTSNLSHVDPPQGCSGDSPEPSGSQTAAAAAALGPDGPTSGRIDPRDRDSGVAASYAAYAAFGGQPRGAGGRGGAAGSGGRSPRGTGTGPGPPGYGGVHSGGSSKGFPMQPPGTGSVGTVAAARASLDLLLSGRMSATEAVAQACQSPSNPLSPGRGGGGVGGGFGPADPGSVQGVVVRASSHARSQSVAPPGGGSGGGVSSDGQVPMFGQTSNPNDRGSRLRTSGQGPGGGAGTGPAWERLPTGDLNPSGDQSLGAGGTQRLSNRSSSQRPSGHGEGRGGGHSGPVSGSGLDPRLLDARGPRASGSPGGAGTRTNTPLRSNAAQVAQYLAMMEEDLQLGFVSRTSSKAAGEMEHLSGPSSRQGSQSTQQGRSGAPSVVLGPAAGGGGGGGGGTGPGGGGGSGTGGGLSNRSLLSAGPSQGALPSGASTPQMLQGGTSGSRLSPGPRMSRPSLMPGGAAGSGGGGVGGGAGGGGAGAGSGGRLAVVSNTSGHHLMMQLNAAVAANAAASGGGSSSSVSPRKATTSGTGVTAAAAAAAAAAAGGGSNGGGPVAGGGARAGRAGVGAGSARGSATGGAGSGIADPVMRTASTASTHDSDHGMIVLTGSADGQLLANRHCGGAHGSSTAGTRNNTGSGVGSGSGVGTGPNAGPGPGPAPPSSRRHERDPGDHAPVAASGPAVAPGPIPGPAGPHPLPSKSSSHPVLSVTASELQLPGLGPAAPSGGLAQILPGIAGRNPNPLKASSQPTMNLGQGSGQVRTGRLPGHSLFGRQASSKGGDLGRRASATSGGSGSGPNGQPPAGVGANPPLSRTLSSGARALSNLGLTAGSAGDGRGDQELHPHGQRVIRAGSASAAASMLIRHPSESAPNAPGSASAANGGTSVSARWGSSRVEAAAEVAPSTGHSSRSRTSPFQQRRGMQIPDISVPLDPDPDLGDAGIEHLGVSHALTSPAPVPRTVPSPRAASAAAGGGGGSAAAVVAALRAGGAAGGAGGGGGGGGAVGIVGVLDVVGSPRAGSASGPGTPSGVDGSTTPGGGGGGGTGNGGGRLWIATVTSAAASPRTGMPAVGGGLDGPDSALTSPASGSHAQHSAAHPPVNKELHKIVKRLRPSGGSFTGSGNSPLGLPPAGTGAGGAPSSGGGGRGGGSVRVSMGGSSAGGGGGRGGGGSFTCSRRSSIDSPAPSYGSIGSARSATAALPSGGAAAGGSGSATGAATTAAGGGIMAALHRERMLWGRGLGGAVGGSGPSAMSVASSGPASPIGSAGGGTAGGGVTGGSSGMLGRPVSRAAASNLSAASVGVGPGAAAGGGGGGGAAVDPRAVSCSTAVGPPSGVPGLPRSGGSGSGARGSASGASAGRQSSAGNAGVTSTPQALGASGLMGPLPGGGSNPGIHPGGGGGGPGSHLPAALASPMLAHVARAVSQASSSVAPRMVSESALSSTTMGGWTGRDELPLAGEAMYALTGRAGTIMYMAPEVIRDEPYNEKVDVFSFGVVLYEVFGRVLLLETYGKDELEALSARISNGYRHSRPECMPPAVWDIVQQCWAQNPADRPNMPLVVRQLELALEALNEADAASAAAAAGSMRPGSLFGTGPYSEGGGLVGTGSNAPGSPLMFGTAAAGSAGGSNTTITVGEKQRSSGKSLASHKSLLSLGSLGRRSKGISFRRRPSLPRAPPQPSAPTPGRAPPLPANYMLSIDVAGLPGGGAGNSGSLASPQSRGSVGAAGLPDSPHGPERERPPPRCAPCGCVIC
ncbi:hypothetical protein HYH03_013261 [Edaphochlamys debaryana]|uniref:Protein kinase domain-containing protein n=1 Tax=Edaphochlamys debaryana TaxID=47281 RepID=A0A836BUL6_9CHLO|nr:hypothetical protein HYH03_013261 [Edaphochlamys debaryana]|eukprot:KAG2488113.1 hypothetical protein HYH03_013261 [Edaphochlamys debaryana]